MEALAEPEQRSECHTVVAAVALIVAFEASGRQEDWQLALAE